MEGEANLRSSEIKDLVGRGLSYPTLYSIERLTGSTEFMSVEKY